MKATTFFRVIACTFAVVHLRESTEAANKPKQLPQSTESVQRVLESEADSSNASIDRRDTLKPESRPVSDPDSVWWQAGYTRSGTQWRTYEESTPFGDDATKLDEYRDQRSTLSDQAHGQWKLANWCRKHGLFDQERVHLLRVLSDRDSTVNTEAVYERLGCQKIGNAWVSPKERQDAVKLTSEIENSHKSWGSKLETLVQRLDGSPKQRSQAEKSLKEIDDPAAVPVIVASLCTSTQFFAECGVRTLGQIPEYQASRALAGQAVFSPWKPVRAKAIDLLKHRKLEEFAPDLLLILSNPIRTKREITVHSSPASTSLTTIPDFRMNWDYVWIEESHDTIRVGIRRLFPISTPASLVQILSVMHPSNVGIYDATTGQRTNGSGVGVAYLELFDQAEQLDYAADTMNDFRTAMNERVGKVLSDCTNEPLSSEPKNWWQWWTNFSSVSSSDQKNVVIVDERKTQPNIPSLSIRTVQLSCLVAGTPVWTERGFVAIEQIQPGDRVLSKEIETGELTYKPVLQTTLREPTSVLKFSLDDESIEASLGHHFWVSGDGWTKTRQLNSQQPIHTATGMRRITNIEDQGRVEKVYNLVVADSHTYFVGKSMVLSHDVLPPSLTNVKIPGMQAR